MQSETIEGERGTMYQYRKSEGVSGFALLGPHVREKTAILGSGLTKRKRQCHEQKIDFSKGKKRSAREHAEITGGFRLRGHGGYEGK